MSGKKGWLLAAGAAAAGAAAFSGLSIAMTRRLVGIAIERDRGKGAAGIERAKARMHGTADTKDFMRFLERKGEGLGKQRLEEITIPGHDGTRLVGHWAPAQSPERIILAMHGWRSSWNRDFGMVADYWHSHHCSVLFAEQRGQGNSGGAYMTFGMLERYDCRTWAHWLAAQDKKELPIYLAGVSMGATTVLMAADLELPEQVRGIIADCGFTSPYAIWHHVAKENLHLPWGMPLAEGLCKRRLSLSTRSCSAQQTLRKSRLPVLLIHGTEDHFVPVKMTYENYLACAGPKRLLIVPGADHGMSYYLEPQRYQAAMEEFWQSFDGENGNDSCPAAGAVGAFFPTSPKQRTK